MKAPKIDPKKDILMTTLAFRERLMTYFKDTCVQDNVHCKLIKFHNTPTETGDHRYQRDQANLNRRQLVKFNNLPVMKLCREPDECILLWNTLGRSKELTALGEGLLEFFESFLPYVSVKVEADYKGKQKDDSELMQYWKLESIGKMEWEREMLTHEKMMKQMYSQRITQTNNAWSQPVQFVNMNLSDTQIYGDVDVF